MIRSKWPPTISPGTYMEDRVALLRDLEAFFSEHRRCSGLGFESGGEQDWVVIGCSCGAMIARQIPDESSDR